MKNLRNTSRYFNPLTGQSEFHFYILLYLLLFPYFSPFPLVNTGYIADFVHEVFCDSEYISRVQRGAIKQFMLLKRNYNSLFHRETF